MYECLRRRCRELTCTKNAHGTLSRYEMNKSGNSRRSAAAGDYGKCEYRYNIIMLYHTVVLDLSSSSVPQSSPTVCGSHNPNGLDPIATRQ